MTNYSIVLKKGNLNFKISQWHTVEKAVLDMYVGISFFSYYLNMCISDCPLIKKFITFASLSMLHEDLHEHPGKSSNYIIMSTIWSLNRDTHWWWGSIDQICHIYWSSVCSQHYWAFGLVKVWRMRLLTNMCSCIDTSGIVVHA